MGILLASERGEEEEEEESEAAAALPLTVSLREDCVVIAQGLFFFFCRLPLRRVERINSEG